MKTDLYNVHFSIKLSQVLRVFFILLKMWLADTQVVFYLSQNLRLEELRALMNSSGLRPFV